MGGRGARGYTVLELMVAMTLAGLTLGAGWFGLVHYREAVALDRATAVARGELALARALAISRREVVRVRIEGGTDLVLRTPEDSVLKRLSLRQGAMAVDSARLRPATLSYNPRGQGSPGSLYLYRGRRGVRIVSNFIGRLRVERFGG